MVTITRPAALVRQGSLRLYATSLKVSDLKRPNFYAINKLDPDDAGRVRAPRPKGPIAIAW